MNANSLYRQSLRTACLLLAALSLARAGTAAAEDIGPQTKIQLTVIQWMPTKGVYEKWEALGGQFVVADDGTISLPVLGAVTVGNLDEAALAEKIAVELKARIGLVEKPQTFVSIAEYPPIYVVGDVTTPGMFPFRKGLTVLQALAMAGGEYRQTGNLSSTYNQIGFVGEIRENEESVLRSQIRLARLKAEMAGANSFDPQPSEDQALADQIYEQEKQVFLARAAVVDRQSRSFTELRELMAREIDTLEKKIANNDQDIESVRKELANVKPMVEKGVLLPTRQIDLERTLRSYQATRLDMATAIMRAQQNIAEATRNLDGLTDNRNSEVASQLQAEEGNLKQLLLKREVRQKQLRDAQDGGAMLGRPGLKPIISYSISRRTGAEVMEFAAAESTSLRPGDVVRATKTLQSAEDSSNNASASMDEPPVAQASQ